jgi:hypothetical protein
VLRMAGSTPTPLSFIEPLVCMAVTRGRSMEVI